MKALPNNCRRGNILVKPDKWKTGGNSLLRQTWYIKYRFYDDNLRANKQVMISRFNTFDTIDDRREAMKEALKQLDYELEVIGYNPITERTQKPVLIPENEEINKWTPFIEALKYVKGKLKEADTTMTAETDWSLREITNAAQYLRFDKMNIWDVTLRHLYLICERAAYKKDGTWSGNKFNTHKKVLRKFYKKLIIVEVVQANYPISLERQKTAPRAKKVLLTKPERVKLIEHLQKTSTRFLLFINIFFHSGSRITEMLRVKVKDVDLQRQVVTYLVMKGREYSYKERPIKDIAVGMWREAIGNAKKGDYVWSDDLLTGNTPITTNAIKQRWKRIKEKLNIKVGMYSLKHLNTTETAALIGIDAAAIQNAESVEMLKRHYDIDSEKREHDKIKKVSNTL